MIVADDPRVVTSPDAVPHAPSVVTIGVFDGVHRGHQTIIGRAVREAAERDLRSVAVTFDRHPLEVLRPGSQPRYLMSARRRVETLVAQGLDLVVLLEFTRELARRSPAGFVESLLAGSLQATTVIVGTNFRFGHQAAGDVAVLAELGEVHGFTTEPVTLLSLDGTAISSTAVRTHLDDGDVEWARRALDRPHLVSGEVVRGDGRGTGIGVPTANVTVDESVQVPGGGVYAGYAGMAEAGEPRHPCVVNIGTRPTFHHDSHAPHTVEVHLLEHPPSTADGSPLVGELYGHELAVAFTHRLRAERRFDDVDALIAQIHADVARARELL